MKKLNGFGWVILAIVIAGVGQMLATADSIVQITAEIQGLEQVSPDALAPLGTYWLAMPNASFAPLPIPPANPTLPVYAIANGEYLVDDTGGQLPPGNTITAMEVESNAVVNLINQIQTTAAVQPAGMAMAMDSSLPLPGFGGGGSGELTNNYNLSYNFDTNLLWLQITNVFDGIAYANLYNATNQVYAVWSTTDLTIPFANWQVETEVWPTDTNCMPFTVATSGRQGLFLRAQDWTGVDSDGDGVPDWWSWEYWGTINVPDTNADYSGNGYTFSLDYSNNVTPTVFTFTGLSVTNNYINTSSANVQLNVAGMPYYLAVSVDDTNFQSDALWEPYSGSNIVVNLGMTEGWHDVCIGLRGHGDDPIIAVWQCKRLKLDFTSPTLFITNPTNAAVDIPMIQLQGFSPEALSSISYDLNNAAGLLTNQQILVLNQTYDTNSFEFTTNTFQAFDVVLTNGLNTFIFHVTDLAGNTTTASYSITLDYSDKTNPPSVEIDWPQDGTQVSGSSFTVNGQVKDSTISLSATVTSNNGLTNTARGLVERTGKFWVQNLPLNTGTNTVALTATDVAGNVTTTNFSVIQSTLTLTVDPVSPDSQLWQPTVNLTGTISDAFFAVWVNGVKGHNNGNSTWSASNVPVDNGGTATFTATAYAPNEQQPDGSYGN